MLVERPPRFPIFALIFESKDSHGGSLVLTYAQGDIKEKLPIPFLEVVAETGKRGDLSTSILINLVKEKSRSDHLVRRYIGKKF